MSRLPLIPSTPLVKIMKVISANFSIFPRRRFLVSWRFFFLNDVGPGSLGIRYCNVFVCKLGEAKRRQRRVYNERSDKWFFNEEIFAKKRNILKAVIKLAPFISFVKLGSFSFFPPLPLRSIKKSDESIVNFLINDQIFCSVASKTTISYIKIPCLFFYSFLFLIQHTLREF